MTAFEYAWAILKNDMLEEYHDKIAEAEQKALDEHIESIMEDPDNEGELAYEESLHALREAHAHQALQEAREKDREYDADYWARKNSS